MENNSHMLLSVGQSMPETATMLLPHIALQSRSSKCVIKLYFLA
jgi:hypothetical protein